MQNFLEIIPSVATVSGFGLVFGLILSYASKKFAITPDEKEEKILTLLPGANCGACGFAGCSSFAKNLAKKDTDISKCPVMNQEARESIAKILGIEVSSNAPMIAAVHCQGGINAKSRAKYYGISTCTAEYLSAPNRLLCDWGCLGHGDCVTACKFDAIFIGEEGYPVVDKEKCTGCGACVTACPKNIISLIPKSQKVYLGCRNPLKGKVVKDACKKGCIGCRLCSMPKITPSGKVKMDGNLPVVPPDWDDFQNAVEKCPSKCFVLTDKKEMAEI